MTRIRSISLRLAIMFALVTAIASGVAGGVMYLRQSAELDRHAREELQGRFVIVQRLIRFNEGGLEWEYFRQKLAEFTPADGSLRFVVESADPAFRINEALLAEAQVSGPESGFGSGKLGHAHLLTLAGPVPAYGDRPAVRLVIAADQGSRDQAEWSLITSILALSVFKIIIVAGLGWWIARGGMRPVDRLSDHARHLGGGDLTLRLPTARLPAELSGMVLALNDALDRLQASHQQLADFNADVAHELRTPLTNMIGETEVALSRPRSAEELKATLQSNAEELERLRAMINDMLLVARADAGEAAVNFTPVNLAAECRRAADFMEVLFEEAGTRVTVEGEAMVEIERALFGRALTNLLDNALKHGEPGGEVSVRVTDLPDRVEVTVINPGPPIPPNHLDRIFDRFFCGDPSRASNGQSHGLGLAIVAAVARMHGGEAHAENGDGVVRVGLSLAKRGQLRV